MSDKSRRKLLRSIAAGSGVIVAGKSLPESWSKPVVDSVMLPAHALTSTPLPAHAQTPTCTPCLVEATFCGSLEVSSVAIDVDGTVTVVHTRRGIGTDTVDPCAGGAFEVIYPEIGQTVQTTVSGTIPCGSTESINIFQTDGLNPAIGQTVTQAACE